MNLMREFEMARREAVTFLDRKDQKTEIRRSKDNQQWVINRVVNSLSAEQINKRYISWMELRYKV